MDVSSAFCKIQTDSQTIGKSLAVAAGWVIVKTQDHNVGQDGPSETFTDAAALYRVSIFPEVLLTLLKSQAELTFLYESQGESAAAALRSKGVGERG